MFRQDVCPAEKQSVQFMLAARQLQRIVRHADVLVHWQHDSRGCLDLFVLGVGLGGGWIGVKVGRGGQSSGYWGDPSGSRGSGGFQLLSPGGPASWGSRGIRSWASAPVAFRISVPVRAVRCWRGTCCESASAVSALLLGRASFSSVRGFRIASRVEFPLRDSCGFYLFLGIFKLPL